MNEDQVMKIFERTEVITLGHFVLSSLEHSGIYMDKNALYKYPEETLKLCFALAARFSSVNVDVVLGPATGGIILSHGVAFYLSKMLKKSVLSVYADKVGRGSYVIKRGYEKQIFGKNVLVVDDVVTTGFSIKEIIEEVRKKEGVVVGLGVLCKRSNVELADVGNPPEMQALVNIDIETWKEEDCPLCKKGIPIDASLGRGEYFLKLKSAL